MIYLFARNGKCIRLKKNEIKKERTTMIYLIYLGHIIQGSVGSVNRGGLKIEVKFADVNIFPASPISEIVE